jgi:hypothetical protein
VTDKFIVAQHLAFYRFTIIVYCDDMLNIFLDGNADFPVSAQKFYSIRQ